MMRRPVDRVDLGRDAKPRALGQSVCLVSRRVDMGFGWCRRGADMDTSILIGIIVVLVIIAVVAAGFLRLMQRRRQELQERFGPEYERAVSDRGDRREAERQLRDLAEQRDRLDIRTLPVQAREGYVSEWERVQGMFVDRPGPAVDAADQLVARVMRDRGYPVDDFESRAEMAAVDHPDVVEHYRAAHTIHARNASRQADTEELRTALVHYRALFDVLLRDPATGSGASGSGRTR
jgi:hypothetical protein